MKNLLLISAAKLLSKTAKTLNLGHGSTWPGHIALSSNKKFIHQVVSKNSHLKIIIVAGTNGKTTTTSMIRHILEKSGKRVLQNISGANLLNGIASTLIINSTLTGRLNYDYAIFEIDENALPLVIKEVTPDYLVLLNLFRDQLDRYGEVRTIAGKWKSVIQHLPEKTKIVLNGDDPEISFLGNERNNTCYFGLNDVSSQDQHDHAVDSLYCPKCGNKLTYKKIFFSHLGEWQCDSCKLRRPHINLSKFTVYPLSGMYNKYNALAAVLTTKQIGLQEDVIHNALENFTPAFGRQEVVEVDGKKVQIFLSKNPTSFNQSFRTIQEQQAKAILLVLNDRIPDGRDISWIWDTELEGIENINNIIVSGDRVYDIALRIKYTMQNSKGKMQNFSEKVKIYEDLNEAIQSGLELIDKNETLFILPTYSAMLEVRKIITGRRIL